MKICVAQMKPAKCDIATNLERHCQFAEVASSMGADLVVFPELSLTGYEPQAARQLAMTVDDARLDGLEELSRDKKLALGVGLPTGTPVGTCISMVIFQPDGPRLLYSKRYIHADERPFFVCGSNLGPIEMQGNRIAMAICFELSVARHASKAASDRANIYLVSAAKSATGVEAAHARLAEIATSHSMLVLLSNAVGPCDNFVAGGRSAAWNRNGELVGQLDEASEGLLLLDTASAQVSTSPFPA